MESYGIHEVLAIKSHQIQWNLKGSMNPMGSMRFWHSNLIKSNGIIWDPCDFSNQISSNPMESYGIHGNPSLLIIENLKKIYSQNDRFLIKFCLNIISLDSSQRVPTPHEPMSPIKNNQGAP